MKLKSCHPAVQEDLRLILSLLAPGPMPATKLRKTAGLSETDWKYRRGLLLKAGLIQKNKDRLWEIAPNGYCTRSGSLEVKRDIAIILLELRLHPLTSTAIRLQFNLSEGEWNRRMNQMRDAGQIRKVAGMWEAVA